MNSLSVDLLLAGPMLEVARAHLGLGDRPPSRLLDIGCGYGARTALLDTSRTRLIGVDLDLPKLVSGSLTVPDEQFVCGDCEELPIRDGSVDALLSFSLMQYVDCRRAMAEARRVLADGAPAVFIENLRDNPFVGAYRRIHRLLGMTYAGYQRPRGHLSWADVDGIGSTFAVDDVSVFHLVTPLAFALPFLRGRPQRPVTATDRTLYRILARVDSLLLRTAARRWGWMVVIRAHAA